jgi:hypothetical protein
MENAKSIKKNRWSEKMIEETIKEKIARQDHDTLIRVEAAVNNMASDLKALADGWATRITSLENRVVLLEKTNDEAKPKELYVTVSDHDRQLREANTTIKILKWLVGSFAAIIGLVSYITKFFGIIN